MAINLTSNPISSVNKFAEFFHLNPFYFNYVDPSCIMALDDNCIEFWTQYNLNNFLSIESLGQMLEQAENEVALYFGLKLNSWVTNEPYLYPKVFRHGIEKYPLIDTVKFNTDYPISYFGQKAETFIDNIETVPINNDGDIWNELHTVTVNLPTGISSKDIVFYYPSTKYQIKDFTILSDDGSVAVFAFESLNLIKLNILNNRFTISNKAHNLCEDIYLEDVDVYYVIKDACLPDVKVYYLEDNCTGDCDFLHAPACGVKLNDNLFKVRLQGYDEEGCVVDYNNSCIGMPEYIEVNYYTESKYSSLIQNAIYYMVAARFPSENCVCGFPFTMYQLDGRANKGDNTLKTTFAETSNPFGSRVGEIKAYNILTSLMQ
jgi:hypothetical protein